MNFAPDRYHQKNKSESHIALRSVSFALNYLDSLFVNVLPVPHPSDIYHLNFICY